VAAIFQRMMKHSVPVVRELQVNRVDQILQLRIALLARKDPVAMLDLVVVPMAAG
jgi:hypothetical protein